jgi:hypothetical protein
VLSAITYNHYSWTTAQALKLSTKTNPILTEAWIQNRPLKAVF